MRVLFKIAIPVEAGNSGLKTASKPFRTFWSNKNPKRPTFCRKTVNARVSWLSIFRMRQRSQPSLSRGFLALNAAIEATPVMKPANLLKSAPAIAQAVKAYGSSGQPRWHKQLIEVEVLSGSKRPSRPHTDWLASHSPWSHSPATKASLIAKGQGGILYQHIRRYTVLAGCPRS